MCLSCICLFVLYVLVFVLFLFLLVSGLAAVCDCVTPWNFLLTFFIFLVRDFKDHVLLHQLSLNH